MSNKVYDILKWIALYLLPAAGTLYFALAGIWNFPCGEQVVGTITAVDTFLGVILGISNAKYSAAPSWSEEDAITEPIVPTNNEADTSASTTK